MPKLSPDVVHANNLAVLAATVELGTATLQKVMGTEEASTQLHGETQSTRDIQELIAARMAKAFGG